MGCCKSFNKPEDEVRSGETLIDMERLKNGFQRRTERRRTEARILTRQLIKCIIGKVSDHYEVKEMLGEGAFGCARKVIHKCTGVERAMKTIMKTFVKLSRVENMLLEVEILRKLDHPNIIKITEVIQDSRCYHIVSELCTGGELFDKIMELEKFKEKTAAMYMYQIISAISYCHSHNVLHRDIKPENFLIIDQGKNSPIKVIDFGISQIANCANSPLRKCNRCS